MKTHVYKLVLGFVFTLLCISTQAQDYYYIPIVKPGIQIWTTIATTDGYQHYNRFALTDEDTLIDNYIYKKLYWFQDSVFNPLVTECIGGLRENAQKQVFYKGKTGYDYEDWHNEMIYDFSLSVGDTFYLRDIYDGLPLVVSAVDTIEIDGTQRRQLTLNWYSLIDVCTWTEGIGSDLGLIFDMTLRIVHGSGYGKLLCYEHNGVLQYMAEDVDGCGNPFLSLNDIDLNDNSITLYPNPTNNQVNISSESIINSIEVFNSLGQRIYQTNVKSRENIIDINSLSKGVYIIGVSTDKGYIKKKLIKN